MVCLHRLWLHYLSSQILVVSGVVWWFVVVCGSFKFVVISSSSSQYCAGQRLAPHNRTLGDLEWEVESTTVTHSSADWWDLLLPLA